MSVEGGDFGSVPHPASGVRKLAGGMANAMEHEPQSVQVNLQGL